MARRSKNELKSEEKKRRQLRWNVLRLNQNYRKAHDVLKKWLEKRPKKPYCRKYKNWQEAISDPARYSSEFAILPYQEPLLEQAIKEKLVSPFPKDQEQWGNFERILNQGSISVEMPPYCQHLPEFLRILDSEPKSNGELFEKIYKIHTMLNEPFTISFIISDSIGAVKNKVDEVFELIDELRPLLKIITAKPEMESLEMQLRVYEDHVFNKRRLRQIAKEEKFEAETLEAAYKRIKKRFDAAKEIIEKEVGIKYKF